ALLLEAELLQGRYERPVRAPTIEKVFDAYIDNLQADGKAAKTLAKVQLVRRRVLELAGQRGTTSIMSVDLKFVDAYRSWRSKSAKPPAPKTIANELMFIRIVVNFGLSRGMIRRDPLKGLKVKKARPRSQPCWSHNEVETILAAARGPHLASLVLLAETGMRVGELRWLTWADIDLRLGVVKIQPKDAWQPKTGDQRVIPMSPRVRASLSALPRRCRWVVTAAPSSLYPDGKHQISERRLLEYLKRVLKRLRLKGHLHTFRHAFISHALTRGIPEAIVRKWVGHVDAEILKHYTHIADAASQAAMQRLAEADRQPLQQREARDGPENSDS
ncbi:MAG TPA: site-specific integrase, partial [Pirellulales bacterium]|nr:site-specific integrase [Pirellulales bacterium]